MPLPRRLRRAPSAAVVVAVLLAGCGDHGPATSPVTAAPHPTTCPLTGSPAPSGTVPDRPALAVKVDNLPAARPPYGLSRADIVYEEPVEGGITRLVAIFQCQDAPRIEPVRSARLVDPEILAAVGTHPLFAYAGGIEAAVAAVRSSSLVDVGTERAPAAYRRDPSRAAPHNLATSTASLYAAGRRQTGSSPPPPPVSTFGPLPAGARPVTSLHIAYPSSDLTWTWRSATGLWSRSYADTGPATLGEGGTVSARNVVVMKVGMYPSPYIEDPTGTHENLLTLTGSGPAQVLRDGAAVDGTWSRPSLPAATRFLDPAGRVIPLAPGPTWVELVPTTVATTARP